VAQIERRRELPGDHGIGYVFGSEGLALDVLGEAVGKQQGENQPRVLAARQAEAPSGAGVSESHAEACRHLRSDGVEGCMRVGGKLGGMTAPRQAPRSMEVDRARRVDPNDDTVRHDADVFEPSPKTHWLSGVGEPSDPQHVALRHAARSGGDKSCSQCGSGRHDNDIRAACPVEQSGADGVGGNRASARAGHRRHDVHAGELIGVVG